MSNAEFFQLWGNFDIKPTGWTEQNERDFQAYLEDFDPSPQNYGDGYSYPPDRFEFLEIMEEDKEDLMEYKSEDVI
jgi:hypothetical protein